MIEHPDGTRQLAIESLETTNGPDVHVWLSAGPVIEGFDGWFTAAGYEYVDLGPIKGNLGDQLYDIPAGVGSGHAFRTVDLWCVQFAVSFGAAALVVTPPGSRANGRNHAVPRRVSGNGDSGGHRRRAR